ncbi:MAG: GntR family transcriptional regulator [Ignavibacteria bacterium]|nr:GntR family transcriptional regulator [Ignavibacteria bacterium]
MIVFSLDPRSGIPYYKQIADQIRFGIASGNLKVGEQLPTVRALAVELKINLNTVAKAYKELELLKFLETQQGTGTFISARPPELQEDEKQKKLTAICSEFLSIAASYGFTSHEIINEISKRKGNI